MANFLKVVRNFLFWATFFVAYPIMSFAQDKELTDSTIVRIFNPEKQLKLWYGSEDFPITNFVILPKYALLYNQEKGKIRLLRNSDKLVVDEYNLRNIKKIMLINGNNRIGQKIKYPLGPINAWFSTQNDTTVLAGTVTFKNPKMGSGYVRIKIVDESIRVDVLEYFTQGENTNKIVGLSKRASYITSMYQIGSNQIIVTSYGFLDKDLDNRKGEAYIKDSDGKIEKIYSVENSNERLLNPIQVTVTDKFVILYDTVRDVIQIYSYDMVLLKTLIIKQIPVLNEKVRRFFGKAFLWDAFDNVLYYKQIYDENGKNARTLYKVEMTKDVTFYKKATFYTVGYAEQFINQHEIFTLSNQNKYIYTISLGEE